MKELMIRFGNFVFKYRDFLFPVIFVTALISSKPIDTLLDATLDGVGLLIACLGQTLRILTVGYEYIKRGGMNKKIYAEGLVTGGVFAHSRNPLYFGNLLILIGLACVANAAMIYGLAVPFFIFSYASLILAEEAFLHQKFGDHYEEYCRRVNRILPNWKGFKLTTQNMTFNWKRVINKEHGSFFYWVMSVIALRTWSQFHYIGHSAFKDPATLILVPSLITVYAIIRVLKKKRLLE